jgi:hypothetical protein
VGDQQLTDLSQRLARLADRQAQGADMASLTVYADTLWGVDGKVKYADRTDLPAQVADWSFASDRSVGDVATFLDETDGKAYLAQITNLEGSSAQKTAQAALCEETLTQSEQTAIAENPLEYHTLGMRLVTA